MSFLKNIVRGSVFLTCLLYILRRLISRVRLQTGDIETDSGATHASWNVEESVRYIEEVFLDYQRIAGVSHFQGRMAELGPGDNAGVALLFLNDGCTHADLADRFYSQRQTEQQHAIYEHLIHKYPTLADHLKEVDLADETTFPHLHRYYGPEAAGEVFFDQHQGYEVIVSRAVLEHLDDPTLSLKHMYRALNIGGVLLHKVDLRDHGMFTPYHHHSKFLEIPKWLYQLMTKGTGLPNRILLTDYRAALEEMSCSYELFITSLYGVGTLEKEYRFEDLPDALKQQAFAHLQQHKKHYVRTLQGLPDDDLIVSGFFLRVVK